MRDHASTRKATEVSAKSTSKRTFSRQSFTVKTTRDCGEQEMRTNNAIPRPSADSFECASVLAFRIAAVSGCFYTEGVDRMTGEQTRRLVNPEFGRWVGEEAMLVLLRFLLFLLVSVIGEICHSVERCPIKSKREVVHDTLDTTSD